MFAPRELADAVVRGDRRAIAKAITLAENDREKAQELLSLLYRYTGQTRVIGITGPGGVGKSTLVEKMIRDLRLQRKTIGVVAVDPTSPFSGGAFLGDRIRMQELSTDEGVFIRSMATRSNPGGLSRATKDAVHILEASGKDAVIIETVGAGQSEVDIIRIAQTVVVVLSPAFGDEIQAIKAGIMEIGDIFVVNKADRENADKAVADIQAMLSLTDQKGEWTPPIVKTTATKGQGIADLLERIKEHGAYLEKGEALTRRREMAEKELVEAIGHKTTERILAELRKEGQLDLLISKITKREIDPYSAAERAIAQRVYVKHDKDPE